MNSNITPFHLFLSIRPHFSFQNVNTLFVTAPKAQLLFGVLFSLHKGEKLCASVTHNKRPING